MPFWRVCPPQYFSPGRSVYLSDKSIGYSDNVACYSFSFVSCFSILIFWYSRRSIFNLTLMQICYVLQNLFFCSQGNIHYNIDAIPVNMFVVSIASFPLPVGLLLNLVPSPISSLNLGGRVKNVYIDAHTFSL